MIKLNLKAIEVEVLFLAIDAFQASQESNEDIEVREFTDKNCDAIREKLFAAMRSENTNWVSLPTKEKIKV